MHEAPPSSASHPGPLRLLTCSPSISLTMGTRVLSYLNLLHSLCVREADSHAVTGPSLLVHVLRAVIAVLFFLGAGLCLWKTRDRKQKMEPVRGGWHFSLQSWYLPSPMHLTFPSPAFCFSGNVPAEGRVGVAMTLGFIAVGEGRGFHSPDSSSALCVTQVQDCMRSTGTTMVASTGQS